MTNKKFAYIYIVLSVIFYILIYTPCMFQESGTAYIEIPFSENMEVANIIPKATDIIGDEVAVPEIFPTLIVLFVGIGIVESVLVLADKYLSIANVLSVFPTLGALVFLIFSYTKLYTVEKKRIDIGGYKEYEVSPDWGFYIVVILLVFMVLSSLKMIVDLKKNNKSARERISLP